MWLPSYEHSHFKQNINFAFLCILTYIHGWICWRRLDSFILRLNFTSQVQDLCQQLHHRFNPAFFTYLRDCGYACFSCTRFLFCLFSCVLSQLSCFLVRAGAVTAKRKKGGIQSKVTFSILFVWIMSSYLWRTQYQRPLSSGSPQLKKTICLKV